jgi:hypothetical protein
VAGWGCEVKGVTLLELLRFYAEVYVRLSKDLLDLEMCRSLDERENVNAERDKIAILPGDEANVLSVLVKAKTDCEKIGLQIAAKHADELLKDAKSGFLAGEDVKALHENIERELSCRFYVGISEERKAAFCESRKGWEEIIAKFANSTEDIEEMNKCFALCRYSAAIFHSLLVVEHGLVKLGNLLGVTDPKEGWDASCKRLEAIVKAGRNANATGIDFTFLDQLNACAQAMKSAWRNKVNHATGKPYVMSGGFAPYVAEEIISATRGFMRRLAEGIS